MQTNLSRVIYTGKEYVLLRGMTSMQRGFLMHSWEWEGRRILSLENCFRRRNRQEILATSNGVVVDLPEGGVPLGQLEAALAEGPDVHQSLDEGEEQCR